jgi:UDP-glucuronate 4-epimerase
MISVLEDALGRTAKKEFLPLQPGDVAETYADIAAIAADYAFQPTTRLEEGIPKFIEWFAEWRKRI